MAENIMVQTITGPFNAVCMGSNYFQKSYVTNQYIKKLEIFN